MRRSNYITIILVAYILIIAWFGRDVVLTYHWAITTAVFVMEIMCIFFIRHRLRRGERNK